MSQVTVTINNREYPVDCEDGQEARIFQLSNILDEKAKMFAEADPYIHENILLMMVSLVLADELSEAKKGKSGESSSADYKPDEEIAQALKAKISEIKGLAKKLEI